MKKLLLLFTIMVSLIRVPIYSDPLIIIGMGIFYLSSFIGASVAALSDYDKFKNDIIIQNYLVPIDIKKIYLDKQNFKEQFISIRVVGYDVDSLVKDELEYINNLHKTDYKLVLNNRTSENIIIKERVQIFYKIVEKEKIKE